MPHLVQVHKKYAKEGVVTIAVQLDSLDEKDLQEQVAKILKGKGYTGLSLILNEESEFWQKKLRFVAYPSVYVFNREGKWSQFKDKIDYEAIDRLVEKHLKK